MSATLASLRIRNLALVEELTWEPPAGFVAITGETGAGKSVILGALHLILGERADKTLIRSGAESCTVEAVFENVADARLLALLDDQGAEPCEDGRLIIRRTLSGEGAGRQHVNGSACTLALLRSLGDLLVDLHGPHDHQSLFSQDQQTRLLDAFAGSSARREEFSTARRKLLKLREERETLLAGEQAAAREIDLLDHQLAEIEAAALRPEEEDDLVGRQRASVNARRIGELCAQMAAGASGEDDSAASRLTDLSRLARELARLDPGTAPILAAAEAAFAALEELSHAVQSHASALDSDPASLAEIELRLDTIQTLKRKYGSTVAEVLAFGEEAASRLGQLRNREKRRDTLDEDITAGETALRDVGAKLTAARTGAAKKLASKVQDGLKDLGFAKAGFSVACQTLETAGPSGFEAAEFLFAPNPGEPERPLRAIASSGEISRVMLALKSALADQDDVPVLVFDEIDANVGGEIAARVGQKMRELGQSRQVLCITHLPQVAASAVAQFVVTKEIEDNRTRTLLAATAGSARVEEIARMLGGKSASALAHAQELLDGEKPVKGAKKAKA